MTHIGNILNACSSIPFRIKPLWVASLCLATLYGQAQPQLQKGYPERSATLDVRPGFMTPPKGYGNIPFYWWNGDRLEKERLKEQLEILSASATDGFSVSYMHLHPQVDAEKMKGGYGLFGKTDEGKPAFFTEEWWNLWSWFSEACAEKGMGVGLDDYTVGWTGNGYYPDEVAAMPKFKEYQGELDIRAVKAEAGSTFTLDLPRNLLGVVAWPGSIDLLKHASGNKIVWNVPEKEAHTVYIMTTKPGYLIHPDYGKEMVNRYFDRFEKSAGSAATGGMNYFFQDEMLYPIRIGTWSEDFREVFADRKGYDILPFLPALKEDIGPITQKIRMDYCEVLVDLAQSRYMTPVYDWHAKRGLIYGSDNLGRGLDPLSYVDYFRINSGYTAPGNDAPARGSSFLQTKVSSSIAHLYERPRTWLEAFHSMGWGSSGEWLTRQIDHHMVAGGNLVCMHGLYYSTHGGWWEWAPPCFHFRMPYWPHFKKWLEYTERMSYLLSQGVHVCDIAILYPTETMQAYPGSKPDATFKEALELSSAGLDYDFIDYTSLQRAEAKEGCIQVSGEKYRVLVLANLKALHYSSLEKICAHFRAGGIVLATGNLPEASSRKGKNDNQVDAIIKEVFGLTAAEAKAGKKAEKQVSAAQGVGLYLPQGTLADSIHSLITPDFKPSQGKEAKVLHRRIGFRDLYMVTDVEPGSTCFFRSTGKVELWNAWTGETEPYPVLAQDKEGTWLSLGESSNSSFLLVFSPGSPLLETDHAPSFQAIDTLAVDGLWEVELKPTLDNKWGDFRLPRSKELIAAEARTFRHCPDQLATKDWMQTDFDDSGWKETIYGYGEQAILHTFPQEEPLEEALNQVLKNTHSGTPLEFSWQYGVWDNPGSQGYHGLKGKVSDGFFILDQGGHQLYETYVYAPEQGVYKCEIAGTAPNLLYIDAEKAESTMTLTKGWHRMIAAYGHTKKMKFTPDSDYNDPRNRSAVVLFPESDSIPAALSLYDSIISTRWGISNHLLFDPYAGSYTRWNYRFQSVPGLAAMEFSVAGHLSKVWIDGVLLPKKTIQFTGTDPSGIRKYRITLNEVRKEPGTVAFSIDRNTGYQGTSVLCEPVKLITKKGLLPEGDWSETGALKYYSGGMIYSIEKEIPPIRKNDKVILDVGKVVASCEVEINGSSVGFLMSPPYELDITDYVRPGTNEIKILVYSTLSNHYQTIPSPYRGEPIAGLLGPVHIRIYFGK